MRVVAIVPTYRNLLTLPTVVDELMNAGMSVIVIDDGSDDGTNAWGSAWASASTASAEARVLLTLPENQGKGAALAAALAHARTLGFDAAVTVDSDGQHRIPDALRLVQAARADVFLLGFRSELTDGYPAASLLGRRLWALGIRALTGLGISDPICGLRCYPLAATASIQCRGGRYAWEEEFLVHCAWKGIAMEALEIATIYQPAGERVSHFKFFDWIESILMFLRLAGTRLFFLKRTHAPRGPLALRDRSWRRIQGIAAIVAGCAALCAPLWLVIPVLVWIAWRLHASVVVIILAALISAALASVLPAWAALVAVVCLAYALTQAARCLCSN